LSPFVNSIFVGCVLSTTQEACPLQYAENLDLIRSAADGGTSSPVMNFSQQSCTLSACMVLCPCYKFHAAAHREEPFPKQPKQIIGCRVHNTCRYMTVSACPQSRRLSTQAVQSTRISCLEVLARPARADGFHEHSLLLISLPPGNCGCLVAEQSASFPTFPPCSSGHSGTWHLLERTASHFAAIL
jgi:hypothetical protein